MWTPVRYNFIYGKRISAYFNLYACTVSPVISVRFKSVTMKYLNVAEKNDAAKNIAMHLSRGSSRRREGKSKYNKIYEFEADVMGQKSQMVMTSVSGHLLALDFVQSYRKWNSCSPLSLFDAQVMKFCPENYQKIKETLEDEIVRCQGLIIWTDCDREGENIGFEIIKVCTEKKSNLQIYRAKFSEITSASVHRALRNLEQPNKNISDAVEVRQELDLRIGAAFTRLQTLRLQKVFPNKLPEGIISYGSCQFPTLGFVVERYRAIENFVAEYFWKLAVSHTIGNLTVNFTWERGRLFDKHACEVLYAIVTENPMAKVIKVDTHPKSKWRPLPLDTVELEKLASRKLKINAKETMRLAEKLYTQGFISYPRTETNQFPKEMNLGNLVQMQTSDTLSGNEFRLYEFIVRSFLACCSKDAQGQETTVTIDVANEIFTANGLMIIERNYLEVYPYDKWAAKEIHRYEMGQNFPASPSMAEGTTSPPSLLTESDLIALMEKHGIGTDATHAEHIETIKDRNYVTLSEGVYFMPTLLGMGLVEGYDAMGLHMSKPDLRARFETDLKAISEGRKPYQVVLAEQIEEYKRAFIKTMEESNKLFNALGVRLNEQPVAYTEPEPATMLPALKCPKCGGDMMVSKKKNNDELYIGCRSFPNCKNAVWLPSFVKKAEVLNEKCPTCGPNYNKIKFEWRNNAMLSHLYPSPAVVCIGGCDVSLLEYLQIQLWRVKPVSNSTLSSINSSRTNSSVSSHLTNGSSTNGPDSYSSRNTFQSRNTYQNQSSDLRMPAPNNWRSNQGHSRPVGNNRGRSEGSRGREARPAGGPRAPRRCGLCRQEGHSRNNCPNRDQQ